jgi:hypothetical protein
MSETDRMRCPHCNAELENEAAGADFWVRCGGCGRRVMPKSWSRIVNDAEPSALFRPTRPQRGIAPNGRRPDSIASACESPRRRLSRNQVITLAIPSVVASAAACLFFEIWYSTSDLLVCGFMGFLIALFIVFVPGLLVSVGTGAMTLAFFSSLFGFSGNEFGRGAFYFGFGFVAATILQLLRDTMAAPSKPADTRIESSAETTAEPQLSAKFPAAS